MSYWDEMILDVGQQLELKHQIEVAEQELDVLTEEECVQGIRSGLLEYKDQRIVLAEYRFLKEEISMVLPQSFRKVPEGLISQAGGGNQQLFGEEGFDTSFLLQKLDVPLKATEIESFMNEVIYHMKQNTPGFQLFSEEMIQCQQLTVGTYQCLLPTERGNFCQVACICSVAGQTLIGAFQFLPDSIPLWEPLSRALIRTLKPNHGSM